MIAKPLTDALYTRLAGDAALIARLADKPDGNRPGIYTYQILPHAAAFPFIWTPPGRIVPFDTKDTRGFTVTREIRCYTRATGDSADLETIADLIYARLHRHPLEVLGFHPALVANCTGPNDTPTDGDVAGLSVQCEWLFQQA